MRSQKKKWTNFQLFHVAPGNARADRSSRCLAAARLLGVRSVRFSAARLPPTCIAQRADELRKGDPMAWRQRTQETKTTSSSIADGLRRIARPLGEPRDLDPLLERIGDAKYVLLGEASHGTSEFYTSR